LPGDPAVWGSDDDLKKSANDLSIDLEDFARKLIQRWPLGRVEVLATENRVEWQIPEPRPDQRSPDGGEGALIYGCLVELYYFPIDVIVDFALWYRNYIPLKHLLFVGDAGGDFAELLETTIAPDIRRAYGWKDTS